MEPGTREEKHLKETQTLQQGESHPSKSCRVPSGAEKVLEPAAYRRCGGGGKERLYGKPTTKKALWRKVRGRISTEHYIPVAVLQEVTIPVSNIF